MNRNRLSKMIIATVMAAMLFMGLAKGQKAEASSASLTFSANSQNVRVGDVLEVTLTISADVAPGDFEGYISYDDNRLQYVTGPDCMTGGEGILKIRDEEPGSTSNVRKYTMYFKAVKIGSCTIAMRGAPEVYEADAGYLMSVSSTDLNVEIQADIKASSDASLETLKVSKGELVPEFSPTCFSYTLEVPYETTSLIVSAVAKDTASEVKIEGNTSLAVGRNRVLVMVTAEDGTVEKYIIYTDRLDESTVPAESEQTEGEGELPAEDKATEGFFFYASSKDGDVFLNQGSYFKVCSDDGTLSIPSGFTKTSVLISGNTIVAYSPTEDLSSDFLLLILSKNGGKPELYSFDRVDKTLQRYKGSLKDNIISTTGSGYSTIDEQTLTEGYEKSLKSLMLVVAVLSGVCMLLIILTIRFAMKSKKQVRRRSSSSSTRSGNRNTRSRY